VSEHGRVEDRERGREDSTAVTDIGSVESGVHEGDDRAAGAAMDTSPGGIGIPSLDEIVLASVLDLPALLLQHLHEALSHRLMSFSDAIHETVVGVADESLIIPLEIIQKESPACG
jgi:hypothetical protein